MHALPLYFAYGSNLDPADLDRWLTAHAQDNPLTHPIGPALLPDHRYAYHFHSRSRGGGALDVVPHPGHAVAGMLFAVHEQGLGVLDQKEGVGAAYARETVTVILPDGSTTSAIIYRVLEAKVAPSGYVEPTPAYHGAVLRGLARHRLPGASALDRAREGASPPSIVDHLFVYGTLRGGEVRAHHLEGPGQPVSLTAAHTRGALFDLGECAYPALRIDRHDTGQVQGELLASDDIASLIERIDEVEGFAGFGRPGNLYERTIVSVRSASDRSKEGVLAWTYVMPGAETNGTLIASGDWRRRTPG